ncbi:MAG TPA: BON domain-containing protein [Candidatus Limnocylindria bacterium]|nr:BON domain-containing protein [Candidatus Limnocylindria bacterium]
MKRSLHESGKVAVGVVIMVVLIVLISGLVWTYSSRGAAGVRDTLRLVKDTSQDAATTTKVKTALLLSKHVSAFDTTVATASGEVTLTGEVPTEEVKGLAAAIARDTSGVGAVRNNLTVNPGVGANPEAASLGDRVADLEIKTLVTEHLARSTELQNERITVQVSKRRVSLEGTVDSAAQRRAADRIALLVPGVLELASNLTVTSAAGIPESPDDRLAHRVEFELYATKAVALEDVQVRSQDGSVYLSGEVGSRAEKLLAERVTQSVEGVKKVVNNLSASEEPR